jgi:cold-inducible RNA-binding protein
MTNKKIYVGNLSFNTTQDDLQTEFSKYGEIEQLKLITDMETGRSKGFAFITFATSEAMESSLEKNGEDFDGRPLRVNQAEERKPRNDKGNFNRGGSQSSDFGSRRF